MLDPKLIRENSAAIKEMLIKRGAATDLLEVFLIEDKKWREKQAEADQLRGEQKKSSKGKPSAEDLQKLKELATQVKDLEAEANSLAEKVKNIALLMPNMPEESVPVGGAEQNREERNWGEKPSFDFKPKPHWEIAEQLGILNFEQAGKISGSRFVVYHGAGAALERALINFMLDLHTDNGYQEVFPPALVNKETMTGTGQLPKFEEDLFVCRDNALYLIPTAEVPVTNLHREEILEKDQLPLKYTAYTPCYRREAGSYGKDTRGIIRQHQFNKVELVKFVAPENSQEELEKLTSDAERILKELKLPYRVVSLATGDLGFASAKTYDLEMWCPGENCYREVSSCSNFKDFQARRAGIRYRENKGDKPKYLHTLNGSGLDIGRTFAAILENYQQKDGSVLIPEVLQKYMKGLKKIVI
ncbi:MAG: serine--tRNA ligase [Candidatus Margulisbacteria bacterium]|nr:serine--tRNA ligase [Candidatus Margulisiibacteriota bacterium]